MWIKFICIRIGIKGGLLWTHISILRRLGLVSNEVSNGVLGSIYSEYGVGFLTSCPVEFGGLIVPNMASCGGVATVVLKDV